MPAASVADVNLRSHDLAARLAGNVIDVPAAAQLVLDAMQRQPTAGDGPVHLCPAFAISRTALKEYATLDDSHRAQIEQLKAGIIEYSNDATLRRPRIAILTAPPGSGKSYFVESLARSVDELSDIYVPFNLGNMERADDLVPAVDAVRNLRIKNKVPLFFLDEFDTRPQACSLLLPLLWDGEVHAHGRVLRLGKTVIVLAGSKADLMKALLADTALPDDKEIAGWTKVGDLRSRINGGVITLPPTDEEGKPASGLRQADKICVFLSLLQARFGRLFTSVPLACLAFVARTRFAYSSRSMACLVDALPHPPGLVQELRPASVDELLSSGDAIRRSGVLHHLGGTTLADVLERWEACKTRMKDVMVVFGEGPCVV